ncbi:9959_t:CDS:2 [Racocetra persica]|uniref:9959_t:CDS:1 n=1 Tax=Racocetra persica TaxID=160502 RepID=A0ACA9R8W5_9GLOM|nr:9959_t:CDS:2 [Racocetra persica]
MVNDEAPKDIDHKIDNVDKMVKTPLDVVVKMNTMMKELLKKFMKARLDNDSMNYENDIIKISYLPVLNNKTSLTIEPIKKMPCNDIDRKDRDMNFKITISDIEYDGMYSIGQYYQRGIKISIWILKNSIMLNNHEKTL